MEKEMSCTGQFNTVRVMGELHDMLAQRQDCLSDLHFATFYYRKQIRMLKERKDLILFGAGKYGEAVLRVLRQDGVDTIRCFCDNSAEAIGRSVLGVAVVPLEEAMRQYPGACYVVTPQDYENEIMRQLIHMGMEPEDIIIFNIRNTGMVI